MSHCWTGPVQTVRVAPGAELVSVPSVPLTTIEFAPTLAVGDAVIETVVVPPVPVIVEGENEQVIPVIVLHEGVTVAVCPPTAVSVTVAVIAVGQLWNTELVESAPVVMKKLEVTAAPAASGNTISAAPKDVTTKLDEVNVPRL